MLRGLGCCVDASSSAARIGQALEHVLESTSVRERCQRVSDLFEQSNREPGPLAFIDELLARARDRQRAA
jgi:hypothetical protein